MLKSKQNNIRMAEIQETSAKENYAYDMKRWKGDIPMLAMYKCDFGDMMYIAGRILDGKIAIACNHADCMDTAAREKIPQSVWDYIHENDVE